MHRVLITGALGYLGNEVLKRLHQGWTDNKIDQIIAVDIRAAERELEGIKYEIADIRDSNKIDTLIQDNNVTAVIHLAAIIDSQSSDRKFQYEVDVLGTQNMLDACVKHKVKKVIISSSGAAYGYHADNPAWITEDDTLRGNEIFAYSDHKRIVEEMLQEYRINHPELEQVIFRVCTILGKHTDNLITDLFKKKNILGIRGFKSPFVFIWDQDAANCMYKALFYEGHGIFNLAADGAISNKDLARVLNKKYMALPAALLKFLLFLGKSTGLSKYGPEQLLFIQFRPVLDNHKLKTAFGYKPEKSSLDTFKYYLNHNNISYTDDHINIEITG